MTLEEFWDLDLTTAAVAVDAIINDQGTLLGARTAGFEYPLSYPALWQMLAAASVVNMGASPEDRIIPEWPIRIDDDNDAETVDIDDEGRAMYEEILNRYSAIRPQQQTGEAEPTTE